jgi:hypothetical protein
MFELTFEEYDALRSQNGTLKRGEHSKYVPTAIKVNIQIIRVFTRMRELLSTHKDILVKLEQIEKTLLKQGVRMNKHEEHIQVIFEVLKELLNPPLEPRPRVGFRRKDEQN